MSVPWTSPWNDELSDPEITIQARSSDWGLTGLVKLRHHLVEGARLWRRSSAFDTLVVATSSIEILVTAFMKPLRPRQTLVVYDYLLPRGKWTRRITRLFACRVDRWLVIRSSDTDVLHRVYGVPAERCVFVPFPVRHQPAAVDRGGHLYSAGNAHRDWDTLLDALTQVSCKAVIAPGSPLVLPSEVKGRVVQMGQLPPEEGRALAEAAFAVAVILMETDLPSGPLVLLDAMMLAKPVVATDVAGIRDYVEHDVTALLVPPGDSAALAAAIERLSSDEDLAHRLGSAARHQALHWDPKKVLPQLIQALPAP